MKPLLILFVHGLGATSESTWGQFRRLLEDDAAVGPLADVAFFGFKTAKTRWSPWPSSRRQKVGDLAMALATQIDEVYREYQQIVLVGHSMGGLVVRQYLVSSVRSGKPLRVRKAVLFAVPNQGSEVAALASFFSFVHAQLADLTPDSPFLDSLNADWRQFGLDALVDVTHVVAGLDEAVRKQSAVGLWGLDNVKVVADKTHSQLVEVQDPNDVAFRILRNAVVDFAARLRSPVGPPLPPASPTPGELPWNQVLSTATPITATAPVAPPTFAGPFSVLVAGRAPEPPREAVEAKPRIEELFDILTDPEEVVAALFQVERDLPLAPFDTEYVRARERVADVQETLETQLREAKGRLLLCATRGMGKTREVAELARTASATKWSVLVARTEGDARMGAVLELPATLADARLLVIVDNLHTRVLATANQPGPSYVERLCHFLESVERVLPGSVRAIATTRDEPRFQHTLQLPNSTGAWHTFGVYRLPRFTDESLQQILTALAGRAQVAVAPDVVATLIENSDRKPETVFINVDVARRAKRELATATWKPTEGETWRLRFVTARADQAGVDRVGQTIQLLTASGIPARVPYVLDVATASGGQSAREAIDSLVGEGLLRLRHGVLSAFAPEQLAEWVPQDVAPPLDLGEHAPAIEAAIAAHGGEQGEQTDDWLALALALERHGSGERAEQLATRAVTQDARNPRAWRIRAAIRFGRADLAGAELDLDETLEIAADAVNSRLLRASIRNLRGNFAGALEDLELVGAQGGDDKVVRAQRSTALFQLGRWSEAETAISAVIDRDDSGGMFVFTRAIIRMQLEKLVEAEQDFSRALDDVSSLDALPGQIRELEHTFSGAAPKGGSEASGGGSAIVYAMRGWLRMRLGRHPDAEADLTLAIDKNAAGAITVLAAAMRSSSLPIMSESVKKLDIPATVGIGAFYHLRGVARFNQDKVDAAIADFDAAIAAGFVEGEVYYLRGVMHLRLGKMPEAEQDAELAIAAKREDPLTFALRGAARLALGRFSEAEQDLDRAIAQVPDNPQFYFWRAAARLQQGKSEAGESDLTAALAGQPDNAPMLYARGMARYDLKRFADAEADLIAAEVNGQSDLPLFGARGFARLLQDKVDEAAADAVRATADGRGDSLGYSLAGAVAIVQGRQADVESNLTVAIDRGRKDEWVFARRGAARHELKQYPEAEQDFTAAIDGGSQDPDIFMQRAMTRIAMEKAAGAEADLRYVMASGRDDASVHYGLALANQAQQRYEEAEAEFAAAIARYDDPSFHGARGINRLINGDAAGALADLDLVLAAHPDDGNTRLLKAQAHFLEGNYAEVRAACDAALPLAPDQSSVLVLCVLVGIRQRDAAAAERDCESLEARFPASPDAQACRGLLDLGRGQFEAAVTSLASAAAIDEGWLSSSGLALLLAGRIDEAQDVFERVAASSQPYQKLVAIADLDSMLALHPERASREETQSAARTIRSLLSPRRGSPGAGVAAN